MDEIDEYGMWTGRCEKCDTSHDGHPPDTLGGELRCIATRAAALGASHLVDQVGTLSRETALRRDRAVEAFMESDR